MKINLDSKEIALLMEIMQEWKTHRFYNTDEIKIINGIVNKIHVATDPTFLPKRKPRRFPPGRHRSYPKET